MKKLRLTSALIAVTMLNTIPFVEKGIAEGEGDTIFVSLGGNDKNSGTINSPLFSLEAARDKIRTMKNSGTYPQSGGVTVYLREGDYKLKSAFDLTEEDSGTEDSRITYKAYNGENVRFVGAERIDGKTFSKVTDERTLNRLPVESRGKVYKCDLAANGIDSLGQLKPVGHANWYSIPYSTLIVNEKPQVLARYPNESEGTSAWMKVSKMINAESQSEGMKFKYNDDRAIRWKNAEDGWLVGMWAYGWAPGFSKIQSINPADKTIQLGVTGIEYSKSTSEGKPYYAFNLLEELDIPGEYYFDRENMIAYLYPECEDIENADIIIPTSLNEQINSSASYITFEDLKFGYTLGKVGSIKGDFVEFFGCEFNHVGTTALTVKGSHSGLRDCDFYNLGAGGVYVDGPLKWVEGKPITCDSYVINCDFNKFEQINLTYNPAITLGSGCICENNRVHDAPHEAINFSGSLNKINYNELYDLVKITEDAGAIYVGRNMLPRGNEINYNYFHDILGYDEVGTRAIGIYLDDSWSGVDMIGNVFERVSRPVMVNKGQYTRCINNLLIDGTHATTDGLRICYNDFQDNDETRANDVSNASYTAFKAITPDNLNSDMGAYFPELSKATSENYNIPMGTVLKNNIAVNSVLFESINKYNKAGEVMIEYENNYETSDDVFVDYENGDYRFKNPEEIRQTVPGWQDLPFEMMGLQKTEKRSEIKKSGRILDFMIYTPVNGVENVYNESVKFNWSVAGNGYNKYRLMIAKDENFKEIVKDTITTGFSKTIYDLEPDTQYYWKVDGIKTDGAEKKISESKSGVYTFITSADGVAHSDNKIKITDITELFKDKENWQSDETKQVTFSFNPEGQMVMEKNNGDKPGTGYEGFGAIGYGGRKLEMNELIHFSMCCKSETFMCMGIRAETVERSHYFANPQYVLYCKPEHTEVMCYNPGQVFSKNYTEASKLDVGKGVWHDVVFGAYNTDDGVVVIMMIDGEVAIKHLDSEASAVTKSGYLQLYYHGELGKTYIGAPLMEVEAPVITDIPEENQSYLKNADVFSIGMTTAYLDLVKTTVNDKDSNETPVLIGSRAYVTAEFFSKIIDADLNIEGDTVKYTNNDLNIEMCGNSAVVNGKEETMENKVLVLNGKMMIPIRDISELMGRSVKWYSGGTIVICDKDEADSVPDELVKSVAELINPSINKQKSTDLSRYSYEL